MKAPYLIEFPAYGKKDIGFVTVAEKYVPFEIRRVYWVWGTPKELERGGHAHKETQQVIVAVSGKIQITLTNIDKSLKTYTLENPNQALYIPKMYWRTIQFDSSNSVLLSLVSKDYEESEYIRDFNEFCLNKKP